MSGNNNQINFELLSAHLDDALDGPERLEAERLLANDVAAARYFEQLRANRECLKSLASTSLGSSVADRVIARARAQALAAGLSPDHHVLRSTGQSASARPVLIPSSLERPQPQTPAPGWIAADWIPRSNRILWSALATVAAAILCMVAIPNLWIDSVPQPNGELSQTVPSISEGASDTLAGPVEAAPIEPLPVQPRDRDTVAASELSDHERSPFDSVSRNSSIASKDNSGTSKDNSGGVSRDGRPGVGGDLVPSGVARVMDGSGATDALRNDLESTGAVIDYLLTVDSVMSPQAWKEAYFDTVLERVGVPMASPITADAELTKLLDDSLVSVSSNDAKNASGNGKAALIFIRAQGQAIDRLLVGLSSDREHFPSVSYNLAIDSERLLLRQLLRKQVAAQAGEQLGARVVRGPEESLVSTRVVPNFVPREPLKPAPEGDLGGLSLRALDGLGNAADPVTDVLIILREVPAQ